MMPRTRNLSLTVLNNVFRAAKVDGFLTSLPVEGLQGFRVEHRPRQLVTVGEIHKLCSHAAGTTTNAVEFVDRIRFFGVPAT